MTKRLQVYETPDITVSFDPNVCRHSGVCLRTLPAVFDVRRTRWVDVAADDPHEVAAAVQKCPSGALQFYPNTARNHVAAEQLARRVLFNHLALARTQSDDRTEIANAICKAIARARAYDFVALYDARESEFAVAGWSGDAPVHARFAIEQGLCGAAARERTTLMVNDVAADARYLTTSEATRSEMIVPVIDPVTRDVLGTIDVASHRTHAFGTEDRELIEDCAREIIAFWTE